MTPSVGHKLSVIKTNRLNDFSCAIPHSDLALGSSFGCHSCRQSRRVSVEQFWSKLSQQAVSGLPGDRAPTEIASLHSCHDE